MWANTRTALTCTPTVNSSRAHAHTRTNRYLRSAHRHTHTHRSALTPRTHTHIDSNPTQAAGVVGPATADYAGACEQAQTQTAAATPNGACGARSRRRSAVHRYRRGGAGRGHATARKPCACRRARNHCVELNGHMPLFSVSVTHGPFHASPFERGHTFVFNTIFLLHLGETGAPTLCPSASRALIRNFCRYTHTF